jgi:tetratricopeptide (TPR) repeat protein
LAAGGALLLVIIGIWKLYRASPSAAFAALWIAVTLLPVSNAIPLRARPVAEQRLYIPSVGWVLLVGWMASGRWLGDRARRHARVRLALTLAVIPTYLALSAERLFVWRDDIPLWCDSVKKGLNTARAHNNLGAEYARRHRLREAEKSLNKALGISSVYADAYANLAHVCRYTGRPEEALNFFRKALVNAPDDHMVYARIANALAELGHMDESLTGFRLALRRNPRSAGLYNRIAQMSLKLRKPQLAIVAFRVATTLEPNSAYHHFGLGMAYQTTGNYLEALAAYCEAIRHAPEYAEAHFGAGECLLQLGKPELAAVEFEAVLSIDPNRWRAHAQLGRISEMRGDIPLADYHHDKAAQLRPSSAPVPQAR